MLTRHTLNDFQLYQQATFMIEDGHNSNQNTEANYETNYILEEDIEINEKMQYLQLPELNKGANKSLNNSILTTEADSDCSNYSSCMSQHSDEEMIENDNEPTQDMEERHNSSLKERIPDVDYYDAIQKTGRQIAPEIAADIFDIMLKKE